MTCDKISPKKRGKMGKKLEVVHGAKNNPDKVYKRRAKNKPLREIKKIIKNS